MMGIVEGGIVRRHQSSLLTLTPASMAQKVLVAAALALLAGAGCASGGSTSRGHGPESGSTTPQDAMVAQIVRASRDQVVQLHDVAVGVDHPTGLSPQAVQSQLRRLADSFGQQQRTLQTPSHAGNPSSPTVALAGQLGQYADLSRSLLDAVSGLGPKLTPAWASSLADADREWRTAVTEIQDQQRVDFLSGMPPLLYPHLGPSTVPPSPKP